MGILNGMETTLRNGDEILKLLEEKEQLIFDLLIPGVTRIITKNNLLDIIKSSLDTACFPLLSTYKSREVVTLDCKGLSTKDAVGMMESLAAKVSKHPDLIVIVEKRGDYIDSSELEKRLGLPVVKISALKNSGLEKLMERAHQEIGRAHV